MKRLLSVLVASSLLVACKTTVVPATQALRIGQPFELVMQKAAAIPAGGGPITLTLTEVKDSRCPSGGQCIWAGYVAVTVQLTDAAAIPQTARISLRYKDLPNYTLDSVAVTLNQQAYWLRLLDVTPYPSLAGSSQPTTAKLRLRPR
jgi:hypothetical protein